MGAGSSGTAVGRVFGIGVGVSWGCAAGGVRSHWGGRRA